MAGNSEAEGSTPDRAAVARATAALLSAFNSSDLAGVLAVWSDEGVMMPPNHPSVRGRWELEQYFSRVFSQRRIAFVFTASQIEVAGDIAVERLEYKASAWPSGGGAAAEDSGKGVHVYRRQPDGAWKLTMDIWNSDRPREPG